MENHINIDNLLIFHFQLKERPKQNLATDQRLKDRMMLEFEILFMYGNSICMTLA
jgi:hypothetical protein